MLPRASAAGIRQRHTIDLSVVSLPPSIRNPWSAQFDFGVLDLLRCCSRYFFIGGWRAGRPDGWILSLFLSDYLEPQTPILWRDRNSNVARWLSEIGAVGLACMLAEELGATNIDLNAGGAAGPDYCADISVRGRTRTLYFEVKGSSTWPIPRPTLATARGQVSAAKAHNTSMAVIFAAFINHRGSSMASPSAMHVEDPEPEEEIVVPVFQRHIGVMASTLAWAGALEAGRRLAQTVVRAEDGRFLPVTQCIEAVTRFFRTEEETVVGLLRAADHEEDVRAELPLDEGVLRFSVPTRALGYLRDLSRRHEVEAFHVPRYETKPRSEWESVGPDGSRLTYEFRPSLLRES